MAIQERPYLMERDDKDNRTGNDRYEGFCVDLMEKIGAKAGFNYTFVLVHDNQYGVPVEEQDLIGPRAWTGIIGELLQKVSPRLL
jgi:glutamate receptor, ionotropic, invertebrate